MTEISHESLIDSTISKYMVMYFKSPALNNEKIAMVNNILSTFNIQLFNNFDDIIDFHFVTSKELFTYLEDIDRLIHQFKKTSVFRYTQNDGLIRGNIDWNRTIKNRLNGDIKNQCSYIVRHNIAYENTIENIVLFELCNIIRNILSNEDLISFLLKDNSRLKCYFDVSTHFIEILNHYGLNRRIDLDCIDSKTLSKVKNSKRELYSTAARLLESYYYCKSGNVDNISELLIQSFLNVCNEDTKFELYWLFKTLEDNTSIESVRFNNIFPGSVQIAEWEDKKFKYKIYHNCGKTSSVEFNIKVNDLLNRKNAKYDLALRRIIKNYSDYHNIFLDNNHQKNTIQRGRPDIIIEKYNKKDELKELYLGEVKNTDRKEYASEGLFELLEYMEIAREISGQINGLRENGIKIKGFICSKVKSNIAKYNDVSWRVFGDNDRFLI